jgi:hypothetical protein
MSSAARDESGRRRRIRFSLALRVARRALAAATPASAAVAAMTLVTAALPTASFAGRPPAPAPSIAEWLPRVRLLEAETRIDRVRFERFDSCVRVTLPAAARCSRLTLDDPPRLVLDLEPALSALPLAPSLFETRMDLGPLRYFRTSQLGATAADRRVRFTFEFSSPVGCETRETGDALRIEFPCAEPPGLDGPAPPQVSVLELRPEGWIRSSRDDGGGGIERQAPSEDWIRSGDLHFRNGRFENAAACYERASAPGASLAEADWAEFQLANCRRLGGDRPAAEEAYRRFLGRWPQSIWAPLARAGLEGR